MTPKKSTTKLGVARVAQQLKLSRGNVSHAAQSLGVARNTLYSYINKSESLRQILEDERESIVDAAENALFAAVTEKQAWAVCFALKCLGKSRGYVERQEIDHSGRIGLTYADLVKLASDE